MTGATTTNEIRIEPQNGYQLSALRSGADIVIGGGAAGAGKTFELLLQPLKHITRKKGFGGVIFRRTTPQIRNEGSLWSASMKLYPHIIGAQPKESVLEWKFPCEDVKNTLMFRHLERESDVLGWQGSELAFIGFDELTHFTKYQFTYMLSRNRSTCGIKPYIRATCNPDPDSWVAEFISWWIDQDTGFPITERKGVIRYFYSYENKFIWGSSREELYNNNKDYFDNVFKNADTKELSDLIKSATFIGGSVYENKKLLSVNAGYLGNLLSLDNVEKARLLDGNWKVVISENELYDYYDFLNCFTNAPQNGQKYITADIALEGSDIFCIGLWDGMELIDIEVVPKSGGDVVLQKIENMAKDNKVSQRNICFDADGVGGFLQGFLKNAIAFKNNSKPYSGENYEHLKAQCYYKSAKNVKEGGYAISERVATKMYNDKMTVRQRFLFERKSIKRKKDTVSGKLCINPKSDMKLRLNGESPDLMDMFMMREVFDLVPKTPNYAAGYYVP